MERLPRTKLRKFSVLSMIFAKNMIKKLPACPFVSQTGVSTAIGNGLPIGNHDDTHLLSFQHFPQLQALLPFLCQGAPARPVPQAAFI